MMQNSQEQENTKQNLLRHIQNRQKIRQMYADKGIQMLSKPELLIQDIMDPNLEAKQIITMKKELSQNGYSDFRYLGQGAQGLVILAKENSSSKRYAIKGILIKDSLGNIDQKALNSVNQEIDTLNSCKGSPYVVNFVSKIEGNEYMYLVLTECLGTLFQIINQLPDKKLNELSAIKYAKDIAEGLYYIHSKKCLVNDIKMENILIDYSGNAIVSDFGLADNIPQQSGYTMRIYMGNVVYQAPECYDPTHFGTYALEYQKLGVVVQRQPSERSEACSLGYLIYTMISGFSMNLMFNKHQPIQYKPEFENFTYKRQLQYIIDGLTQFIPRNRFKIKDILIILKGIISLEFSLDSKFIELMSTEEAPLNQLASSFQNEIEFIQHYENKFYPIIKNEQNILQQLTSKIQEDSKANHDTIIEGLNKQIKDQQETIYDLLNQIEQYNNQNENIQQIVQNFQTDLNQVFSKQLIMKINQIQIQKPLKKLNQGLNPFDNQIQMPNQNQIGIPQQVSPNQSPQFPVQNQFLQPYQQQQNKRINFNQQQPNIFNENQIGFPQQVKVNQGFPEQEPENQGFLFNQQQFRMPPHQISMKIGNIEDNSIVQSNKYFKNKFKIINELTFPAINKIKENMIF